MLSAPAATPASAIPAMPSQSRRTTMNFNTLAKTLISSGTRAVRALPPAHRSAAEKA
jgi:hypothetical protein